MKDFKVKACLGFGYRVSLEENLFMFCLSLFLGNVGGRVVAKNSYVSYRVNDDVDVEEMNCDEMDVQLNLQSDSRYNKD